MNILVIILIICYFVDIEVLRHRGEEEHAAQRRLAYEKVLARVEIEREERIREQEALARGEHLLTGPTPFAKEGL